MRTLTRLSTAAQNIGVAACLLFGSVGLANAATETIADGTLMTVNGIVTAPLGPQFDISNGPLTFSGILTASDLCDGCYQIGITVGDVYFTYHPGYSGNGAFRLDRYDHVNGIHYPHDNNMGAGNRDMGFVPDKNPAEFTIVVEDGPIPGEFSATVTILQDSNSYHLGPVSLPDSAYGPGGTIESFGVLQIAGGNNLHYANMMAASSGGIDDDNDGYFAGEGEGYDCNDNDPLMNPGAEELPGNFVDENCDGNLGVCSPCIDWKNHGSYVRCVAQDAEFLVESGILTEEEGDALVTSSAQSSIGKKGYVPSECTQ